MYTAQLRIARIARSQTVCASVDEYMYGRNNSPVGTADSKQPRSGKLQAVYTGAQCRAPPVSPGPVPMPSLTGADAFAPCVAGAAAAACVASARGSSAALLSAAAAAAGLVDVVLSRRVEVRMPLHPP
jgi:hypothetical protein